MKQIQKILIKAVEFKQKLEQWNSKGILHPPYENSTAKKHYYNSIYFNLLECQNGLCAYTESRLAQLEFYANPSDWSGGKFIAIKKPKGSLDHYDPKLKHEGKAWEWDNLFVVLFDLNTKIKGTMKTSTLIKPDSPDYSPEKFFSYNKLTNRFELKENSVTVPEEKKKVEAFLEKILNWDSLIADRKEEIAMFVQNKKFNEDYLPSKFPTAFKLA